VSFQDKYRIQSALSEGEAPSFRALQVSSGQTVLVHHLVSGKTPPQQPDLAILIFKFLSRASAEESRKLIDMGEDEGRIYVVTPDVPECQDLRLWLVSVTDAPAATPAPAKADASPVNLDATSAFTTEALREALRYAESAPAAAVPPTASTEATPGPESLSATKAYTPEAMRQALQEAENAHASTPPATPVTEGAPSPESLAATQAYTREAMRQALREAQNVAAPPPVPVSVGGTPSPESLAATQAFTTEALREAAGEVKAAPAPNPPSPVATPPNVPSPEKGHEDAKPSPEVPPSSFEITDGGVTEFTAFWEKAAPASPGGPPAAGATPPPSPKSLEAPPEVPAVTAEFLSFWQARKLMNLQDAPTSALPTLNAPTAKGRASPVAPSAPADKASGTMILGGIKDLSLENGKAAPPAGTPLPPPSAAGTSAPEGIAAEGAPRAAIPGGFEVVFQSDKPRSRATQLGLPGKSGIMPAPKSVAPSGTPKEAVPAPPPESPPGAAPPAASPPPPNTGGTLVMNASSFLGERVLAVGATREPIAPPLPSPPARVLKEPEPAVRPLPPPATPPVASAPSAPPAPVAPAPKMPESATRFVSVPAQIPNATLRPTPVSRAQPGEYTRMIQNVRVPAGPLPAASPLANPPAAGQPAASPSASSAALQPPAYPEAPAPLPASRYIASDTPLSTGPRKRQAWVPIVILSSLFLTAVALLLFFAFKP
jgi:hypothetical protein